MANKTKRLLGKRDIKRGVKKLAQELNNDYRDRSPILVCILKGAVVFLADLIRELNFPLRIDFISVSSYGDSSRTSGVVKIIKDISIDIEGENVLLVEDIVDTGLTLSYIFDFLKRKNPRSLKICALLEKRVKRTKKIKIDYRGFTVPNKYVIGYGLDFSEKYRNLPEIITMEF
ncbi:MAG: hypoxanthine phosphoribosyltransferase [Candidatus Cloacimonadota bacterium]|nr:MAG: hypoxanthine phosphoribosyltransferase [Candidatus Cloacimonadota bacterium]